MYASVEVNWVRGRDPEMQVHNCDGRPPSKNEDLTEVKTVKLSSYTHDELHWVLQCHGFVFENATAAKALAPAPLPRDAACEALAAVDAQRMWRYYSIAAGILITCAFVLRCAVRGPPSLPSQGAANPRFCRVVRGDAKKLKMDDELYPKGAATELA